MYYLLCLGLAFALVPSSRDYCASSHPSCSSWCLHFSFFVSPSCRFGCRSSSYRTFLLASSSAALFLRSRHHGYSAPWFRRGLCAWKFILVQDSGQVLLTTCFGPGNCFSHNTVCFLLLTQDLHSSHRGRLTRGLSYADGLGRRGGSCGGGAGCWRVDDLHHRDCATSWGCWACLCEGECLNEETILKETHFLPHFMYIT